MQLTLIKRLSATLELPNGEAAWTCPRCQLGRIVSPKTSCTLATFLPSILKFSSQMDQWTLVWLDQCLGTTPMTSMLTAL